MASSSRAGSRSDFILLAACVAIAVIALALPAASREPVAGALRTTIVAPLIGLQHGAQRWRSAWLAREQEVIAKDSMALRMMEARAARAENDQLRRLLGLARRLESGFVPADVLPTSEKDVVTSVVLSAGSNAGVRRLSPVIAPDGLVGIVESANPTMSIAILYTNPSFAASAMTPDNSAFGIVYPHLQQRGLTRQRQYLLELRDVPYRTKLEPGTEIVTSGLGGTYPRGVPIGTVISQLEATPGLSRTYLVAPAVTPSKVTAVFILMPQRAMQGVGNIWASAVAGDSATRAIVAAADSLARNAALLEKRARDAVLDSLRRAVVDSMIRVHGLNVAPPAGTVPPAAGVGRAGGGVPPVRVPPDTTVSR